MKKLIVLAIAAVGAFAFAEGKTTKTTTTTTTTTATAAGETPAQVCAKLVEAAKSGNFDQFKTMATQYEGGFHKGEKKFNKMGGDYMNKIKEITCGAEHVADGKAVVEATEGGKTRLIPFTNTDGQWKFDAKTYMSFYPHKEHGKKM